MTDMKKSLEVFDRTKERIFVVLFVMYVIAVTALGFILLPSHPYDEAFVGVTLCLLLTLGLAVYIGSAIFGVLAKQGIVYRTGRWKYEDVEYDLESFADAFENHKRANWHLSARRYSVKRSCCCICPIVPFVVLFYAIFLIVIPSWSGHPLYARYLVIFVNVFVSTDGILHGYNYSNAKSRTHFQTAYIEKRLQYAYAVASVDEITHAEVYARVGIRGDYRIIGNASFRFRVKGLSDKVMIQLQASGTEFVYPSLVGTVHHAKQPSIKSSEQKREIGAKYEIVVEPIENDDDAGFTVRFDMPLSGIKLHILNDDIARLTRFMIQLLRSNFDPEYGIDTTQA